MKGLLKEYTGCVLIVIVSVILGIKYIVESNVMGGCLWLLVGLLYIATITRRNIQNKKIDK